MKQKLKNILNRIRFKILRIRYLKWIVVKFYVFCFFISHKKVHKDPLSKPLWIFGMFRSGTSLTSEILKEMGTGFGPEGHLLQAIGKLKDLNPNGFFENYVFAEYSRFFLAQINSSGENPPDDGLIKKINFNNVYEPELFNFSITRIKEDRISAANKLNSFKELRKKGLNGYLSKNFGSKPVIKIPLLSFFYKPICDIWPNSKFLVVFRHPVSTINSSKILTELSDYSLYKNYYSTLIKLVEQKNVYFFSYDFLIKDPLYSIQSLEKLMNLPLNDVQRKTLCKKIDSNLIRNLPGEIKDPEVNDLFKELNNLAINKIH